MVRPRKPSALYVRGDGQCYLSRNAYDQLLWKAREAGIKDMSFYIRWDKVDKDTVAITPLPYDTGDDNVVKLNASLGGRTLQFKSRTLASIVGGGYKKVIFRKYKPEVT